MIAPVHRPYPWIWMSAGFLSLSLIGVLGVMLLIGWNGLSFFWVAPVYQFEIQTQKGKETFFGEIYNVETVSSQQLLESGLFLENPPERENKEDHKTPPYLENKEALKNNPEKNQRRYLIKIANREREGQDFISVLEQNILSKVANPAIAVIERTTEGAFFGIPVGYIFRDESLNFSLNSALNASLNDSLNASLNASLNSAVDVALQEKMLVNEPGFYQNQIALAQSNREEIAYLENYLIEELSDKLGSLIIKQNGDENASEKAQKSLSDEIDALRLRARLLEDKVIEKRAKMAQESMIFEDRNGQTLFIPIESVLALWYPNALDLKEKWVHFGTQIVRFIRESPREGNAEGGVFPAIFGTVLMVMLMAVIVTPLGVLAALYLHEYATKNIFTRFIRISVINLAGVPSIVYGVFGLGFFIYFIGGNVDALFYSDALPNPTFGTPGLLWSSLTLAILTLPVVIVSTEEGLSRIPLSVRHGSMALGATQAETLWRIVLPMASPAIMTGLVLAMARAAGEVAPLMLVGVVKVAPSLALDAHFPYLHLDRKFMHLGYHIYDAGFQSPNIEAARPLVYATSLLLLMVIISLNLTAMSIRHHLREKYRALEETL